MNDLFYEQLTPGRPRLPKILYILLGATIVAAASYWAKWVVSVANF